MDLAASAHVVLRAWAGAPRGEPHCTVVGCTGPAPTCTRAITALSNLLVQCIRTAEPLPPLDECYATYTGPQPTPIEVLMYRNAGIALRS